MRVIEPKEQLYSTGDVLTFTKEDRIVGVSLVNQGTSTVRSAFGQSKPFREILPLSSASYGGFADSVLTGKLTFEFEAGGSDAVVLVLFTDKGEVCE